MKKDLRNFEGIIVGVKGAEENTVPAPTPVPEVQNVSAATEGALGASRLILNGETFSVNPDWTYADIQFAFSQMGAGEIPASGYITTGADGTTQLQFANSNYVPQNVGTKGADGDEGADAPAPTPVPEVQNVSAATEGALGASRLILNGETFSVNPDWTYADIQFAFSQMGAGEIPASGYITTGADGTTQLQFANSNYVPQNVGTKG